MGAIDLARQTQGVLGPREGGTGSHDNWSQGLVEFYGNETGGTLQLGTVVVPEPYPIHAVTTTSSASNTAVLGVVVGGVDSAGVIDTATAPADGATAAVMRVGIANVLLGANVSRGQYAYSGSSNGGAIGASGASAGAFGVFLADGTVGGLAEAIIGSVPVGSLFGAHAILSASHTDATAATVQRGDLISGQGTASQSWQRLAKGAGTTDQYLGMLGSSDPQWANRYYGLDALSLPSNTLRGQVTVAAAGTLGLSLTSNTVTLSVAGEAHARTHAIDGADHTGRLPSEGARVYKGSLQTIAHATTTPITFDNERWDTGYHSLSTNTSRITIPAGAGGTYLMGGNVTWAGNVTGRRSIFVYLNGTTGIAGATMAATSASTVAQQVNCLYRLAAGDYVELMVYQESGGDLDVTYVANRSPEFWAALLGD